MVVESIAFAKPFAEKRFDSNRDILSIYLVNRRIRCRVKAFRGPLERFMNVKYRELPK